MKKLNFTFLLAVLLSMVGARALAHDIEVKNGDGKTIYYQWANNKTELSVSYRGDSYDSYSEEYSGYVVIPKSVTFNGKTYPVTSIGNSAFYNCSGLTNVTIPNSVTFIGGGAFYGCSGLKSVTIPNSVTSIGNVAFADCSGLMSIVVQSGNTKYDSRNNCNAIIEKVSNTLIVGCKSTIIPNSVMSIGYDAFLGCKGLTSITIPNSVTNICGGAFGSCSGLKSVTIPNSVTNIGAKAFKQCSGLTSVTIPNSVTSIGDEAFVGCSGLKSVTIPNSVTSIGWEAFRNCSGLTSATIPNSVTAIGFRLFWGCTSLKSVTIGNSVTSINTTAFDNCPDLTSIVVQSGNTKYDSRNNCNAIIEKASNKLIVGCKNTIIPNSVTSIGYGAFSFCSGLMSMTIPNSVTSIGSNAFNGCSGLKSVVIGNSVTTIDSYAFNGCSGLTSVTIPNAVTCIDAAAFNGCSGLTSVTIPNSVTSIGWEAFRNCSGLTSATIGNSVTSIERNAFDGCTVLNTITCYATTPPTLLDDGSSDSFAYDKIGSTCKVFVPKGCVNAYKAATGWKRFSNIYEIGTIAEEGFDLQAKLDEIAASGTTSSSNLRVVEIPASGITIDKPIEVRNGCHAILRGGPIRISPQIQGKYPTYSININKSNSLHFEYITMDFMNDDFSKHDAIFKIEGNITIRNGVKFANFSQISSYGKRIFLVDGGTFNFWDGTIKVKGITIISGISSISRSSTINVYGGELESTQDVIRGDVVYIKEGKVNRIGDGNAISATNLHIGEKAVVENTSSYFPVILAFTAKIEGIVKGGSLDIRTSAEITGSKPMPPIGLADNAIIMATSKLEYKWTITLGWHYYPLGQTIVEGSGKYKLTEADFKQMTFEHLPSDREAYYDAKDCSVKLREKTVVEEKVDNSDDLQNFIDGLGDNKGTEDDPIKVPVGDDGLVIDKDVDIEDDLQLLIDGTGRDDLQILIDGGYINQKVGLGYFGFKNLWMGSSAGTRASASGGGINNRGKMVFSNCTLENGNYSINNFYGGMLILKDETVTGSGSLIVNSGDVFIDGSVSVGNLENTFGGRIYIMGQLTRDIHINYASEDEIELNTPIVMGDGYFDYYSLTAEDLEHISISLPEGFAWEYSKEHDGIVIVSTSGITGVNSDSTKRMDIYDMVGRKQKTTGRGVLIQRMSNGEVRKMVIK